MARIMGQELTSSEEFDSFKKETQDENLKLRKLIEKQDRHLKLHSLINISLIAIVLLIALIK